MSKVTSIEVGQKFQMQSGRWLTVIGKESGKKITVKFDESGFERVVEGVQIRRGTIRDWVADAYCVGNEYVTKNCGKIVVLKYTSATEIEIMFKDTGWKTTVEGCQIKRGNIQDKMQPTLYGVGFLGDGPHLASLKNGKGTWAYNRWSSMLERCYSEAFKKKQPNYEKSLPCKDWLNFQNFAEWAVNQKGYENSRWHLDKDILVKGNKLYTPKTCCFVPIELNSLLVKAEKCRGSDPIGLSWHTNQKYVVHVHGTGASGYVGIYDDADYAFKRYKEVKEAHIKQQANKWRDQIDPRAYEALMNYQVEITD